MILGFAQQYPPDELVGRDYYRPTGYGAEAVLADRVPRLRRTVRGRGADGRGAEGRGAEVRGAEVRGAENRGADRTDTTPDPGVRQKG